MGLISQAYFNTGDEVLIPQHTFSVYTHVARIAGSTAVTFEMPDGSFSLEALLAVVSKKTAAIFLATPNNPTGGYLTIKQMTYLCQQIPAHVLIVVDHAYADFCVSDDFCVAEALIPHHPNVVTLRTFSKLDGLAGLRIGYAISHPRIAEQLNRTRMPFNINSCALHGAVASLTHRRRMLRLRDRIVAEREMMRTRLLSLGYEAPHTHGNFILLRLQSDSEELATFFRRRGITVRPLHSFGLPKQLRITVASERWVNARVLRILTEYAQVSRLPRAASSAAAAASTVERRGNSS